MALRVSEILNVGPSNPYLLRKRTQEEDQMKEDQEDYKPGWTHED